MSKEINNRYVDEYIYSFTTGMNLLSNKTNVKFEHT